MAAKAFLVLCTQALIAQSALSQCLGRAGLGLSTPYGLAGRDWGYDGLAFDGLGLARRGLGCGCGPAVEFTATSGGGLPVTSASPIPPVGVSVASENVYEGTLAAAGEVPFVGTVAVEGVLPTAGAGAVNYGCGNGVTAMAADTLAAPGIGAYGAGIAGPIGYGAGIAGPVGNGAGWAGCGCGCGIL